MKLPTSIKLLECDRLVEASKKGPKIINTNDIEDDDISEKDSDLG
jgi:hypothetical protein